MKCNFFLFCDAAAATRENKQILHGIFSTINSVAVPATHPMMAVAYELQAVDTTYGADIHFILKEKSTGKIISDVTAKIPSQVTMPSIGGSFNLANIRMDNFGEYEGELFVNDSLVASNSFQLVKIG